MRLNGRKEILCYLGRSPKNKRSWRRTRRQYAEALHYLPGQFRVWTTTAELDAVDRARSLTLAEVQTAQGERLGEAVGGRGGRDFAFDRVRKQIWGTQGT